MSSDVSADAGEPTVASLDARPLPDPTPDTAPSGGDLLAGRYRLGEVIGTGGMAQVRRGHDQQLDRPVAVKVLKDTVDELDRERFTTEGLLLAKLDHPGLVTALDAGVTAERSYVVMELVEGGTLAARLREGPLSPSEVAQIGASLAHALAHAHGEGVVHRDVKPANVLLAHSGAVKLADFGIARLVGDTMRHTAHGSAIGTASYLSPEQVEGHLVSGTADVYSLGLVLLEALTGEKAFSGPPAEAALARLHRQPTIPESLPSAWRDLLELMTARDPKERADAWMVATTLDWLLANPEEESVAGLDLVPAATPARAAEPARSPRSRHRRVIGAATGAVAVAATSVVAVTLLVEEPVTPPVEQAASQLPPGVPLRLQEPLRGLHDAAGDVGTLAGSLAAVDEALALRSWADAVRELTELDRMVMDAEDTGRLTSPEADRILAATSRITASLPEDALSSD